MSEITLLVLTGVSILGTAASFGVASALGVVAPGALSSEPFGPLACGKFGDSGFAGGSAVAVLLSWGIIENLGSGTGVTDILCGCCGALDADPTGVADPWRDVDGEDGITDLVLGEPAWGLDG